MELSPDDMTDWFWNTIGRAGKSRERLADLLWGLTQEQIYQFTLEFLDASRRLWGQPFTDYVEPGESEDGIEDISRWVVSQGKHYYADIWHHPEKMPPTSDLIDPQEILFSVAGSIYRERFGEMPDIHRDFANYQSMRLTRISDYLEARQAED